MHGGNGKVAYIDTEGTLYVHFFSSVHNIDFTGQSYVSLNKWISSRPDRIIPIAERFGMDPGAVLDNVSIISITIK